MNFKMFRPVLHFGNSIKENIQYNLDFLDSSLSLLLSEFKKIQNNSNQRNISRFIDSLLVWQTQFNEKFQNMNKDSRLPQETKKYFRIEFGKLQHDYKKFIDENIDLKNRQIIKQEKPQRPKREAIKIEAPKFEPPLTHQQQSAFISTIRGQNLLDSTITDPDSTQTEYEYSALSSSVPNMQDAQKVLTRIEKNKAKLTQSLNSIDETYPPRLTLDDLGPKTGSANLLNTVTDNETTRMQATGSFLQNVRSPNISKSSLEMPIGSKRKLENVDMFKNKLDNSAPFWQANGLENIGFLPPPAIVENGAFNKPLSTNPQKFVFMTYESGINKFYNCKIPMKVNIPSGDFGIYHVVVNEVLFRTDIELLNEKDYIIIDPNNTVQVSILAESGGTQETYNVALPKIELKIQNIIQSLEKLNIDYLNIDLLITLLNRMLDNVMINFKKPGAADDLLLSASEIFYIKKNILSGLGLRIGINEVDQEFTIGTTTFNLELRNTKIFKIETCSSNFRHIFPPLQTTTSLSSQKNLIIDDTTNFEAINSIEIPRCNFAGPQMFLLNSSAQTVCPISNEYAKQFNTCALSYNTNEETNSLIQMTSNVELTMKNTNDFKVWLTDNYGQAVKLKSPMYVQVTVQPFINESVSSKSE